MKALYECLRTGYGRLSGHRKPVRNQAVYGKLPVIIKPYRTASIGAKPVARIRSDIRKYQNLLRHDMENQIKRKGGLYGQIISENLWGSNIL